MFEENIKLKQRENETDITSHNWNSNAHAENKTKITESGLLSHAFLSVVDGTETRSQVQSADIHPNRFPSVWFSQHSRGQSSPRSKSSAVDCIRCKTWNEGEWKASSRRSPMDKQKSPVISGCHKAPLSDYTRQAEGRCHPDQCKCHSKCSIQSVNHGHPGMRSKARWQNVMVQYGPISST